MWDKVRYHFHTHPKKKKNKTKTLLSSSPRAGVIHTAQFLFPFLAPAPRITVWCFSSAHATEVNKMLFTPLLEKGHDRARTWCSRVVQHPLERGWDRCCSSGKGWAGQNLTVLRASSSEQWFQLSQIGNAGRGEVYSLATNSNKLRCPQWFSHSKLFLRKGAVGAVLSLHLFVPHSWQNSCPFCKLGGCFCQRSFKNSTLKNRTRQIRWWVVNLSGAKTLRSRFPANWITEYLFFHWNFDYYFSVPRYPYYLLF